MGHTFTPLIFHRECNRLDCYVYRLVVVKMEEACTRLEIVKRVPLNELIKEVVKYKSLKVTVAPFSQ